MLAKLQHPSIVTIYELGKSTVGWPFCVLEQVDGVSLRDRLDELAELEEATASRARASGSSCCRTWCRSRRRSRTRTSAASCIATCTPNNILLGKRGEATLIDWGIARDLDAPGGERAERSTLTTAPSMSGRMVTISAGTPPYMPLEQSQGRARGSELRRLQLRHHAVRGRSRADAVRVADRRARPAARTAQIDAFIAWLQSDDPVPPAMPRDRELSGIIARAMAREPARPVHRRRAGARAQAVPDRRPRVLASLLDHRPARAVGAPPSRGDGERDVRRRGCGRGRARVGAAVAPAQGGSRAARGRGVGAGRCEREGPRGRRREPRGRGREGARRSGASARARTRRRSSARPIASARAADADAPLGREPRRRRPRAPPMKR